VKDWLAKLDPKWVITNAAVLAVLGVVLWFVANHMILPMQNAHLRLVDKVVDTQGKISDVQAKEIPILERIDRNTSK
jgi:hypothetical protein